MNKIAEASNFYQTVLKIDPSNGLAKEALLKIGAKKEAQTNPVLSMKCEEIGNLKNRDLFKKSEKTASLSGDLEYPGLDNRLMRGVNAQRRISRERSANTDTAEMEELQGLRGALILIVRIIFDIIGGLLGYGTISPTYYNYM